ncbi:3-hydroxyacyl-CoA dehydrogenase family protein [Nocardioides endophyticus]|uniref:3-hydroxyacyl-CoA dehydrogenase family protein n=1 Tax=Nocardioides endophyticus TaxID=1353775 RepID=A0ABP8YG79_9ACTN
MNDPALTVAVLGAGTMGSGIATVVSRAGHETVIYDVDDSQLDRGLGSVRAFLERSVSLGKIDSDVAAMASRNLRGVTSLKDLETADVVIEAVPESLALKQDLFGQLDDIVSGDTLFHTNTSTLSVTGIAAGSRRPERVVGTHYCNPAPLMKLVEVAAGRHTSTAALDRTREFCAGMGKTSVVTKDRPGFIVNRFLIPWENNCIRALESGLGSIESIDAAVTGALNHPMGPFRLLDVVGLDIHHQVASRLYEQLRDPRFAPPPMVERMIAAGDLGRKTGRGFYTYDDSRLFGA